MGYTINLYSKMLGYEHYKLGVIFTKNIKHEKLLGFAANIDNTVYIDYSISNFDFELNLEYENYEKVEEIINKMKNELGGIKDLYVYKPNKFYKFRYY